MKNGARPSLVLILGFGSVLKNQNRISIIIQSLSSYLIDIKP